MLELLRNKRIMVVVAHPDDELLGLGATINRLTNEFTCNIKAVILGEGITSRAHSRDTEKWKVELGVHNENVDRATKIIGYNSYSLYNLPDNRFDSVSLLDIVKIIEDEKDQFNPDVIMTHHSGDTNIDHRCTFQAVIPAVRPMKDEQVKLILTFETPSSTEWQSPLNPDSFNPNVFIEVTKENIEAKIKGMESYVYEKRPFPHPRSPEALETIAKYRGLSVGYEYAEAFMLIRSI